MASGDYRWVWSRWGEGLFPYGLANSRESEAFLDSACDRRLDESKFLALDDILGTLLKGLEFAWSVLSSVTGRLRRLGRPSTPFLSRSRASEGPIHNALPVWASLAGMPVRGSPPKRMKKGGESNPICALADSDAGLCYEWSPMGSPHLHCVRLRQTTLLRQAHPPSPPETRRPILRACKSFRRIFIVEDHTLPSRVVAIWNTALKAGLGFRTTIARSSLEST